MAGEWDAGQIFYSNQQLNERDEDRGETRESAQTKFREFFRSYRVGAVFPYRDQLLQRFRKREFYLEVNLRDLLNYDPALHELIQLQPNEYLPIFEEAAQVTLTNLLTTTDAVLVPPIEIMLKSEQTVMPIRRIQAADVNRLLRVPGIVISASRTRAKAVSIQIRCKSCNTTKMLPCNSAFGGVALPRTCDARESGSAADGQGSCGLDPYVIVPDKSTYVDQQTLKLQEAPEAVPTGEMPRHMLLSVSRNLVDRVSPGTRVSVIGVSSIFNPAGNRGIGAAAVRTPYLRVVGIAVEASASGRAITSFTPEEEEHFRELAREPDLYSQLAAAVSPSISGDYTVDIKKAILCLLMGGSRRVLPDGMKLRGDINVLMLGDPSTAKSQFLKFVEKVAPVGVYTSGKGSSAAGLTASVIRDAKGEFYLEGGAMVLADGGVVCIDEFDKMREEDRVAIHEAMEQQTISVAKAGITTILNSRSAVLAAANPVFGRYDDRRSAAENIDFLPTILSRFDLIFIVRDICDEERDKAIARHVMSVHVGASTGAAADEEADGMDIATMKKYIAFCRAKCAPRLSPDAVTSLRSHYVSIRDGQRKRQLEYEEYNTVPITVRQLEAIVRLSEALAKVTLSHEATPEHVAEAIRLFKVSTLNAANSGSVMGDGFIRPDVQDQVKAVEEMVKRRLAIGASTSVRSLVDEMMRGGFDDFVVRKAVEVMVTRGELQHRGQRRAVLRVK